MLGDWKVVDGRLQATTGSPRARIAFGPAAPAAFRLEATVRFVTVADPARWLNFGVDYHAADDYGAVVVARSNTTASNGLELAQAAKGGGYSSSPVGRAPTAIGTGQDHKLAVEVHGTQLVVSLDGATAMTATNLKRTGGSFGFVINNSTVQFDDVRVTELDAQATAPAAPQNLKLSEVDDTATVTWGAPQQAGTNADGSPATIARYEVSMGDGAWQPVDGLTHTFTNVPATEQVLRVRAVNSAGVAGPDASVRTVRGAVTVDGYKLEVSGGAWPSGHVQGIAVDPAKGFIYYSFTNLLVKTDLAGNVVGTVGGFTGHLGDLDFNPADGRVYGSLEYKAAKAFYIAIFDVDRIDRVGINAQNSEIVSAVYLPEVVDDFTADLDGNGVFDGDTANTPDHRYGSSGIDGVAFGPRFGSRQRHGVSDRRVRRLREHRPHGQRPPGAPAVRPEGLAALRASARRVRPTPRRPRRARRQVLRVHRQHDGTGSRTSSTTRGWSAGSWASTPAASRRSRTTASSRSTRSRRPR